MSKTKTMTSHEFRVRQSCSVTHTTRVTPAMVRDTCLKQKTMSTNEFRVRQSCSVTHTTRVSPAIVPSTCQMQQLAKRQGRRCRYAYPYYCGCYNDGATAETPTTPTTMLPSVIENIIAVAIAH